MKPIYRYCECCKKPIDTEKLQNNDSSLEVCSSCAAKLLKKIFGEEKKT